jgi:hypothetical protein
VNKLKAKNLTEYKEYLDKYRIRPGPITSEHLKEEDRREDEEEIRLQEELSCANASSMSSNEEDLAESFDRMSMAGERTPTRATQRTRQDHRLNLQSVLPSSLLPDPLPR